MFSDYKITFLIEQLFIDYGTNVKAKTKVYFSGKMVSEIFKSTIYGTVCQDSIHSSNRTGSVIKLPICICQLQFKNASFCPWASRCDLKFCLSYLFILVQNGFLIFCCVAAETYKLCLSNRNFQL